MSHVICSFCWASRRRVCYKRVLPCLVFMASEMEKARRHLLLTLVWLHWPVASVFCSWASCGSITERESSVWQSTKLYCIIQYYTALYYTVLSYSVLHCTGLHCTTLHCTATHYTTHQHTALNYTPLHKCNIRWRWTLSNSQVSPILYVYTRETSLLPSPD